MKKELTEEEKREHERKVQNFKNRAGAWKKSRKKKNGLTKK